MEKSVIITVYIDDVPLGKVEEIQAGIDAVLEDFEHKRVSMQIQDERLVEFAPGR